MSRFPFNISSPTALPLSSTLLLFLAPGPPPVDPLPPQGPAPSGVSQVDLLPSTVPVEVAVDSGAARGAAFGGAEPVCAEPRVLSLRVQSLRGAESGGAGPGGFSSLEGPPGALSRREPLSPPQLREWFAWGTRLRSGAAGARGSVTGGTGAGGTARVGAGAAGVSGAAGPGGACTGGTGAAGAGGAARVGARGIGAGAAGVTGVTGVGAGDTGAGGAGPGGAGAVCAGSGDIGWPRPYFVPLLQQNPGLTECHEPVSRPASPVHAVCTGRRDPRPRPPPVLAKHHMALRPSSVPQRVPRPSPPASSLGDDPDPESDQARATSPTVPRLLATVVTDPSFESTAASALVTKLVHFAAVCRLDYATALVAESGSACPPSVGDTLDIPTPRSYVEAITGFSQRQGVVFFLTFFPTPSLHVVAQRDYELHSLDFSTTFLQGSPHEEIWLRRPPGFTGTTLAALGFAPWIDLSMFLCTDTLLLPFYILVYVLHRFGFRYSSPQSTLSK
ncbi:unnamed protein product [Closterium sp. NIES-53]